MSDLRFSWDSRKAQTNIRKHGVAFEEAQSVFFDEHALLIDDPEHSEEENRFAILGMSSSLRVLLVAHCLRSGGDEIRIINARKAERTERAQYWERLKR